MQVRSYKPSVRALGLAVEGVGFDWLLCVHDLISHKVAGTSWDGVGPIKTSSDGRLMSLWLGGEVTDKAGDVPEKMAGYTAFTVWCLLLTRDKSINTLLELLRRGGIATALATGPM